MAMWNLYVGGLTADVWTYHPRPEDDRTIPAEGIERFLFDDKTGLLTHNDSTAGDLHSPQYLAGHPRLPMLYAAEFAAPGRFVAFAIHRDGALIRRTTVETHGSLAISTAVHPNGARAYVGHLGDGVVTTVNIAEDGDVSESRVAVGGAAGSGSKVHDVAVTPAGGALVATDFGLNEVVTYMLDESGDVTGETGARVRFPEGSAPRQAELHPSGRRAYVVGVNDGNLYVLEAENFVPTRIISTHKISGRPGRSKPAETSLDPAGRCLYVGVRDCDTIAAFQLDEGGDVERRSEVTSHGRSPRSISVDPSGRHLLVANWHSNQLRVFAGAESGELRQVGSSAAICSPGSFLFVPADN